MGDLTPEQRERLLRAAGPQTPSTAANLLAVVAELLAEQRERIAQAIEDECPHEADSHPEGCCEVCDYAFALGNIAREEDR